MPTKISIANAQKIRSNANIKKRVQIPFDCQQKEVRCKDWLQTFLGKKEEKLKSDKGLVNTTSSTEMQRAKKKRKGLKRQTLTENEIKAQDERKNIGTANVHEGQEVVHTSAGLE